MMDVRLPLHLSVEADALYRPLNYTFAGVNPNGTLNSVSPATVVTWEFPVLAKYSFPMRIAKPFLVLGPSFRAAGNLNQASPSNHGFTAGAGMEAHLVGKLKAAPVVRYTRWAADGNFAGGIGPVFIRDQVEILVGLSF